jgi:uncharacterized coiled-coil protein SlyX
MRLSELAKDLRCKKGSSFYGSEENALHDDLIKPFNVFADQEAELVELKKAALYDEIIKPRIPALKSKIAANRKVLDRLENAVVELKLEPLSLGRLRQKQQDLVWKIRAAETELTDFISPYFLQASITLGEAGLQAAERHPKVVEARATSEATIRGIQAEYADYGQKISMLEGILKDFQWRRIF